MFTNIKVFILLGTGLLGSLLTSCGDDTKQADPTPKQYKVQVRYQATNLQPNGRDVGANVSVLLTDKGQTPRGSISAFLTGVDSGQEESSVVDMVATDKIEVDLSFPNVKSAVQAKSLPETTAITTEVVVNGQVLRTIKLDKNTSFSGPTLRVMETISVSEL
ncbi:hypothetical protein HMJ29_17365 [Hymenobacter taeanensis]|uniref:Uncharacterized protein n=1 Tax=Hymenobacter taeanensis TaxID=2735321 RepID=A0A6M6BJ63_9BACT|nr:MULTISPECIES: hypothetical protein [Hymenobacter]QJX48591.1 hypothetical protein HMJ29_17365 [Hymenobacter taeanensis]UOQ81910.1 hypothetical protein MUN83_03730 [Hymenobacter sp. 5414T-23]